MSFRRLDPFVSINAASLLIICERKAKRKNAAGGLSSITSSLHLVLEAGDAEAPREVTQNNHVMISNGGTTDTGELQRSERSVHRQRTLVLSLEAFIFSSSGLL